MFWASPGMPGTTNACARAPGAVWVVEVLALALEVWVPEMLVGVAD